MAEAASLAVLTAEQVRELLRAELEPLRLELERLRGGDGMVLVSREEAARRLGVKLRTVPYRLPGSPGEPRKGGNEGGGPYTFSIRGPRCVYRTGGR